MLAHLAYDYADDPENEAESLGILESTFQRIYDSGVADGLTRARRDIEQLQLELNRARDR